jgi:hypothetical protein
MIRRGFPPLESVFNRAHHDPGTGGRWFPSSVARSTADFTFVPNATRSFRLAWL